MATLYFASVLSRILRSSSIVLLVWGCVLSAGADQNAVSYDREGDFRTGFADAIQRARENSQFLQLGSFRRVRAYAKQQIQKYKPYRVLSDFLPPEVLEYSRSGEVNETDVLAFAYRQFDEEFQLTDDVSWATAQKLLLNGLGAAENLTTVEEMFESLTFSAKMRYQIEKRTIHRRLRESYHRWKEYLSDSRKPLKYIRVVRFSEEKPGDVANLINWYNAAGFKVQVSNLKADTIKSDLEEILAANRESVTQIVSDDPEFSDQELKASYGAALDEAALRVRETIGYMKDVDVIEYKPVPEDMPSTKPGFWSRLKQFGDWTRNWRRMVTREFRETDWHRTSFDRIIEGSFAVTTAAMTTWAMHETFARHPLQHTGVIYALPVAFAIADKLFFVSKQQGTSAFHNQYVGFDYNMNEMSKRFWSFTGSNFLHSWYFRFSIFMCSAPWLSYQNLGAAVVSTIFVGALTEGLKSAARNAYSKGPIMFFLDKAREHLKKSHRPRLAGATLSVFNVFWGVVAFGDVYNWKVGDALRAVPVLGNWFLQAPAVVDRVSLRDVMVGASILGVGMEISRRWNSIVDSLRSLKDRLFGIKPKTCETFLIMQEAGESV